MTEPSVAVSIVLVYEMLVTDYHITDTNTTCHERKTIVDIFQYILGSEADTCGETATNDEYPTVIDAHDSETDKKPSAPDHHLKDIIYHSDARIRCFWTCLSVEQRYECLCSVIDILEYKP